MPRGDHGAHATGAVPQGLFARVGWFASVVKSALLQDDEALVNPLEAQSRSIFVVGLTLDPALVSAGGEVGDGLLSMPGILDAMAAAGLRCRRLIVDEAEQCVLYGVRPRKAVVRQAMAASPSFSSAERVTLVHDTLDAVVIDGGSTPPPNNRPRTLLTDGMALGLVTHAFPLHEAAVAAPLLSSMRRPLRTLPLDELCQYLGHKIAMYFAFVSFYLWWLLPLAVAGVALFGYQWHHGWDNGITIAFSVATSVWATLILQYWKRRQDGLAARWQSLGLEAVEHQRWQFTGHVVVDPVTGERSLDDPLWKRVARTMVVWTVSLFILAVAVALMLVCERLDHFVEDELDKVYETVVDPVQHSTVYLKRANLPMTYLFLPDQLSRWVVVGLTYASTVVYALLIPVLDAVNTKVAGMLTAFENHRFQSRFDDSMIVKLVLFKFFNNFVSLFYIGFYRMNLVLLRKRITVCFLVSLLVQNFTEVVMPVLMSRLRLAKSSEYSSAVLNTISAQVHLSEYVSTVQDMLEMFLQFGFVTLFAPLFPLGPLLAVINNVVEIRGDAYKILSGQRPLPTRVSGLGSWCLVLEALSYLAVVTNCGLIAVAWIQGTTLTHLDSQLGPMEKFAACVALEHAVFGLKGLVQINSKNFAEAKRVALPPAPSALLGGGGDATDVADAVLGTTVPGGPTSVGAVMRRRPSATVSNPAALAPPAAPPAAPAPGGGAHGGGDDGGDDVPSLSPIPHLTSPESFTVAAPPDGPPHRATTPVGPTPSAAAMPSADAGGEGRDGTPAVSPFSAGTPVSPVFGAHVLDWLTQPRAVLDNGAPLSAGRRRRPAGGHPPATAIK